MISQMELPQSKTALISSTLLPYYLSVKAKTMIPAFSKQECYPITKESNIIDAQPNNSVKIRAVDSDFKKSKKKSDA